METNTIASGNTMLREASNPIQDFLDEATDMTDPSATISRTLLWQRYIEYCDNTKVASKDRLGRNTFFDAVEKSSPSIKVKTIQGVRLFSGIQAGITI